MTITDDTIIVALADGARSRPPCRGIRVYGMVRRKSARTGVLSAPTKASTGPTWTRTSASGTCCWANRRAKAKHLSSAGSHNAPLYSFPRDNRRAAERTEDGTRLAGLTGSKRLDINNPVNLVNPVLISARSPSLWLSFPFTEPSHTFDARFTHVLPRP